MDYWRLKIPCMKTTWNIDCGKFKNQISISKHKNILSRDPGGGGGGGGGHSHQLPYGGVPLYRVDFERPVSLKIGCNFVEFP